MKTLYIFLFVMFSTLSVYSQGNLQFNQVLILDATGLGVSHTVPAGKVWKIESVAIAANSSYFQIQWGGLSYFLVSFAAGYNTLPFWLPSNASVVFIGSTNAKVSVIEFNVVP
jgi:hypothetical protein